MEGVTGESNGSLVENEAVDGQPTKEVIFGDMLWVKLHEASWWPAQVVDENSVSSFNKPSISSKRSSSDVLVRLYGSYTHKYVDVNGSRAEFKNILIENNFNHEAILKKSLEQELASLNSSKSRRRQSKGTVLTEASENGSSEKDVLDKSQLFDNVCNLHSCCFIFFKLSNSWPVDVPCFRIKVSSKKRKRENAKTDASTPDRVQNNSAPSTPTIIGLKAQELSGRRMKVMQSLGLVAPSGSPFPRNRVLSPNPSVSN
ncbi:hypothetical protein OSB04_025071 [Centaurea solstitialis]|uniref:PWWP domain-containing protein n=1 Tax=Centaurea solstitialis TaxID=347529 RepID=A0AA38SP07_9ASTR|nr:hypothetical protein OSB04_025071 [Centaurea solstitialis]